MTIKNATLSIMPHKSNGTRHDNKKCDTQQMIISITIKNATLSIMTHKSNFTQNYNKNVTLSITIKIAKLSINRLSITILSITKVTLGK
jgi:hypothetical protein